MASTRRLTAIFAADVAGYSRLMGADEEDTHERLQAHFQQLINPKIALHHGRIVKTTGDGMLAEFASVVDAMRCAAEIQRAMIDRDGRMPDERRIRFRIGINLGDVIAEGDDIFGDGVNVAARLEALAEPGGICVSGTVHDHIRDRLPYPLDDLGEQSVKNIARPVRVYALRAGAIADLPARSEPAAQPTSQPAIAPRLSIVVLPFANLSGDPEQKYFANGITEDLTTDLSRIGGSFVIARSTAFTYEGKPVNAKQIGRQILGDRVGKILLLAVVAQIGKRQHDDRQARRNSGNRDGGGGRRARCRQSGDGCGGQRIDPHRPGNVLDLMLAQVHESKIELIAYLVPHDAADADAAGLRERFQPRRDIDAVAEDVLALGDDVAKVDPDAKPDAPLFGHLCIAVEHPALDLPGAADRVDDASEFRQHAIASGLDDAAAMPGDGRIDQLLEVRSEVLVGAFLVRFHQARIARHVSGEDRGETAGRGHGSGWPTCFEGVSSAIIHGGSRVARSALRLARSTPVPRRARGFWRR